MLALLRCGGHSLHAHPLAGLGPQSVRTQICVRRNRSQLVAPKLTQESDVPNPSPSPRSRGTHSSSMHLNPHQQRKIHKRNTLQACHPGLQKIPAREQQAGERDRVREECPVAGVFGFLGGDVCDGTGTGEAVGGEGEADGFGVRGGGEAGGLRGRRHGWWWCRGCWGRFTTSQAQSTVSTAPFGSSMRDSMTNQPIYLSKLLQVN